MSHLAPRGRPAPGHIRPPKAHGGVPGALQRAAEGSCQPARTNTHGFRLKRPLNPGMPGSLLLCFSAASFSLVQVICTLSGEDGSWVLAATAEWDAVFRSWIS